MKKLLWIALSVALSVVRSRLINAQELTGSITGAVLDATGAAVSEAKVRVVSSGTNLQVNALTDRSGSYLVGNLPIGAYSVTFTTDGFQTESHTSILVQANRTTTVGGSLQVGQLSTTVEVTGTPLLNQVDTAVG